MTAQKPTWPRIARMKIMRKTIIRMLLCLLLLGSSSFSQNNNDERAKLYAYIDGIANSHLAQRAKDVGAIRSRGAADKPTGAVRGKILGLIGGLPERKGLVAVKEFGSVSADGFRVEKIAYE